MRPEDSAGSPASRVWDPSGAATEWKDCRCGRPSFWATGRAAAPLNQWWEWTRSQSPAARTGASEARNGSIACSIADFASGVEQRSEEHTSELQSRGHLVCRLLLEKKKSAG